MSLITIIWSMIASACLTLAGISLLIWCRDRKALTNLFFSLLATGTAAWAFCELWMMRARTPIEFAAVLKWGHVVVESFLADTKHPQFDCLVVDIQLGGISGIELTRRLAAAGGSTPVIFITAHDDPEVRHAAEAVGCRAYFRKTDSGTEVLEAIRRVAL